MFIYQLPLASLGLNWIIPSAIGGVIGAFIPDKG
jgi:LIVCS family branched-chain amino acid:cation transporter